MNTVRFGKTELQVTRLGFGAAPVGFLDTPAEKVRQILGELLDAGVNLVDTGACYPGSEELLGHALADRRDRCLLVSKCGHTQPDLEGEEWSPGLIEKTIDRSLKRMNTDHLDVVLLHSCPREVLEQGDAMAALVRARDAGKVRHVGYSGDGDAAAYAAALPETEVIQTSINIADQHNIDDVLPVCRERDLGVIAKRPLTNAAWREPERRPGFYREYGETYAQRLAAMDLRPHDFGFQGHAELEWPELALRFVLSLEGVHTAIAGTTSSVNARANLLAAQKGPLAEDAVRKIRQAFTDAEQQTGETWAAQM
ncbi:MAG: aldo/keto reductase [Phycisphaeraceae bacterium]